MLSTMIATPLLTASPALAKGGELGILEGRSAALLHPIVMISLFASTLYAAYLGWQWRETRTIGDKIKSLKAELPAKDEEGNRPSTPLDGEIKALESKRKELIAGNFRDKHHVAGSLLLGFGVVIGIEGAFNTYARVGKLFPGPHLYAGAAIVCLWAVAAALTPAMQKGNETARSAHIALNTVNLGLFAWQLPTGWAIVEKVLQFTSWP